MQRLLSQTLRFSLAGSGGCRNGHGRRRAHFGAWRLRTAFLTLSAVAAFVAVTPVALVAILTFAPFRTTALPVAVRAVLATRLATLGLALCLIAIATLT